MPLSPSIKLGPTVAGRQFLRSSRDVVGPEGDLQPLQCLDGGHVRGSLAGLLGGLGLHHVLQLREELPGRQLLASLAVVSDHLPVGGARLLQVIRCYK